MKKIIAIASTLTVLTAVSLPTSANLIMDSYVENALINVCQSVASNKVYQLRNTLREFNLKVDLVNQKLVCNDQSVHSFAVSNGANNTASLLQKGSVKIKDLAKNDDKYYVYFGDYAR
ncbi:MAG: hypothetical protein ACI8WB_003681 [Phenylobacterium sp.]|jgi:hypothetical protein